MRHKHRPRRRFLSGESIDIFWSPNHSPLMVNDNISPLGFHETQDLEIKHRIKLDEMKQLDTKAMSEVRGALPSASLRAAAARTARGRCFEHPRGIITVKPKRWHVLLQTRQHQHLDLQQHLMGWSHQQEPRAASSAALGDRSAQCGPRNAIGTWLFLNYYYFYSSCFLCTGS